MGGEWKPNEEKTQLELISQVSASISAVREVGGLLGTELKGWTHLELEQGWGKGKMGP